MGTTEENIKAIIDKAKLSQPTIVKERLSDEQVEKKTQDMRLFFDNLIIKVKKELTSVVNSLNAGVMPNIEEMDDTIYSFNHLKTIEDNHTTYIPRHNFESNIEVIRLFLSVHYPDDLLGQFETSLINFKNGSPKILAG